MSLSEKKRFRRLTKQDIFELLNKQDNELMYTLNKPGFGLKEFLQNQEYFTRDKKIDFEIFEIIVEVASRMCSSRRSSRLGSVEKFLNMVISCDKFLFQDSIRVIRECLGRPRGINLASFTKNYIIILNTIMRHKLHSTEEIADCTYPALQNMMNEMKAKRMKNLEDANNEFDYLKKLVDKCSVSFVSDEDDDQVQLFRTLSIMPKDNDVINCEVPDLPCNITDRAYNSVDHYLSVHFRLMREDMLRNFRDCIKEHNNPSESHKSSSRIYEQVSVQFPPIYNHDGIGYKLKIRTNKPTEWARKEVLMPGNIVCLTKDDYNSVAFAIVSKEAKSAKAKSTEGETTIRMDDTFDEVLEADINYQMFETNAYFECYKHVLSALREFNRNSLPLSDFLVHLDFQQPEPEYLVNPEMFKDKKYCLHENCDGFGDRRESQPTELPAAEGPQQPVTKNNESSSKESHAAEGVQPGPQHPVTENNESSSKESHLDDENRSSCGCKEFNPLNYNEWPFAEELGLDDQQVEAFQTALTRKVAVIQGPPGTGKTFIGVKVVKALLQNLTLTPIIICCLTNHALDQFLEHIFKFTKNVVRLGSQSKSNILEPHTLENLMMAYRTHSRDSKSSLLDTDNTIKESIKHLKSFAPEILVSRAKGEYDKAYNDIGYVCNEINNFYRTFYKCKDEYLDETALNEIIYMHDKDQLRTGSKSTNSQSLSASVLEWLCHNSTSNLYEECGRRFHKMSNLQIVDENPHFDNLWALDLTTRYELFFIWRKQCLSVLSKDIKESRETYKQLRSTYRGRVPDAVKVEILKKSHVIGVTTTGAAKYRKLLRFSNPKILIVEEAAEVLESHIISSLLPTTQHLILIGDHKQLRPLPANHELSEVYNLKISMFERLFKNKAPSATLVSQHRMKPCIADLLIQDELYEDLKSYENVYRYEDIKGVKSNVFFLNHNKAESSMSSGTSSSNDYEANMIVRLAKYFTVMSYSEDQITILATYAAQVPLIQGYLEEENLTVFVTTVDNYQGEENDIVLVSFVRSNKSGMIGFLKENNRVCVALSRARKGMFCLGNFSSYSARSPLWATIINKLEAQDAIGPKLPLVCSKHSKETLVENPDEIQELMRRGCDEMCGFQLSCGHQCSRKCHYNDPEHTRYQCAFPCEKYITETKKCSRLCYQRCKRSKKAAVELACGHLAKYKKDDTIITKCEEEVQKKLPCNHLDTLPCHIDVALHKCKALIPVVLSCGHKKNVLCYKSNDLNHVICNDLTPCSSSCGHTVHVPCHLNLDSNELLAFCTSSCDQLLTCGHACTGNCRWCSDVGIHALCTDKCETILNCGHVCAGYCGSPCLPCKQKCLLSCSHGLKCINSCYRPCTVCDMKCGRGCKHGVCKNKCSERCSVQPCLLPCSELLPCGHKCIGLCGDDPCPYLCRECHESDLTTGEPKSDFYVQLDDCDDVIENEFLKEHIETCLDCYMWPDCPKCKKPIQRSLRYKEQLLKAKEIVLKSSDNTTEAEYVHYLLNSMMSSDMIVPAEFHDVHQEVTDILHRDKPTSGSLLVLKHCVTLLMDLMRINKKMKTLETCENNVTAAQGRFETLLLWICNHLKFASYQQLDEIEKAVNELKSILT